MQGFQIMLAETQWALIFSAAKRRNARWADLADVNAFKAEIEGALAIQQASPPAAPSPPSGRQVSPITARIANELISHESIVAEAYKDSKGIWTWGVGVTNASGHEVHPRYLDKPQDIRKCLEVYIWLLTQKYLPPVVRAFNRPLSEAELGAALSFHYNTGAIGKASWVKLVNAGETAKARVAFMLYNKPHEIIERREKERDLFFKGEWSGDGKVNVYPVRRPSYAPNWAKCQRVDVTAEIEGLLA
jgi:lysozyme